MKIKSKFLFSIISLLLVLSLAFCSCDVSVDLEYDGEDLIIGIENGSANNTDNGSDKGTGNSSSTLDSIPEWDGETAFIVINGNKPFFTAAEIVSVSYESYGELDGLGRCTVCIACVGVDIMPTEERGSIGSVKPSGWQTVKYDFVSGKYLYNRCHLIGYQLTGENANKQNLITGTRFLNIEGMLPFEDMIADYVKETENHVMFRVTPIFEGDNLVASGVLMEGWSVEDNGDGICFCVYAYNNQPGVVIDYATGDSHPAE